MTEISVAGEPFNVLVEGDETKPVLTLSNPLGLDLHLWDRQIPAFLKHFRVVRYDSRGHGASVANEGPYSIAGLAQDVLGILDALGVEKTHWLGLSKGGLIGQWLLAHAPERIGRAVLANTAAHIPGPDVWNERIEAVRRLGVGGVAESIAERWFTPEFRERDPAAVESVLALLRQTTPQGYAATAAAIRDADQRELIRSITNPVLVIIGRHDQATPPELGEFVAKSIKGAKIARLESSHISNVEDEANFTKAVVDFLTASEAPALKAPASRRTPARKTGTKKAAAKKAPAKKAAAKKAPAKKAPPQKTAARKAPTKAASVAKAATKKASAKKAPAKKTAAKKTPSRAAVKKLAARKPADKKTAAKKLPTKTAAAKKSVVKKTPNRRSLAARAAPRRTSRHPTRG